MLCTITGSLKGVEALKPGQVATYEIVADGETGEFMVQTASLHLALRLVGTKK